MKVDIVTLNDKNEPISTFLNINVVDESVIEKIEKRKQSPN
mgnify:CR=1 FL=1